MTSLFLLGLTLFAAPPGAADLATRLGVTTDAIQSVQPVVLNRQTLGHLVRFTRGANTYGVLVSVQGPRISLGQVDTFESRGIIDLAGRGKLPMKRTLPGNLKSAGKTDPAWVLVTRHTTRPDREVPPTANAPSTGVLEPAPPTRAPRNTHPATQDTLHLISISGFRRVLRAHTKVRSGDGYGGHDISMLTLARKGGKVEITGRRQDHLDAAQARCMKPRPVPVRYVMRNGSFKEVDVYPSGGCGSRGRLPPRMPKVPKTLRP